jgi:glycine betaine/proline transport system ATP-binding protein
LAINNIYPQNEEVSIEVNNLWKIFGDNVEKVLDSDTQFAGKTDILEKTGCVLAIKDVSFQVHRGEIFVLMGLSGSGKSTLVRCILRLVEPTDGKIFINGENVCDCTARQLTELRRHTVSMVFQYFGLLPHRNILENVAYGLKIRGMAKSKREAKAREMIELVGLKGWESYLPSALSGGMQQRVGIARALSTDPKMLIMDEPFSGLDPLIRRQMQDELLDIQEKVHKTILFVTHDLHEALKLGNRIAIMKDGEIIQIGDPEEVITAPSDGYVREFVQDASPAKVLTAKRIMEQPNVLLYEWQGPKTAMHILESTELDNAFVLGRGSKFRGLVTVERLLEIIKGGGKSIMNALEPEPLRCTSDTIVEDLFPLVASTRHPIPVVDDDGKFLGEIHTSTILGSMIQDKETEPSD